MAGARRASRQAAPQRGAACSPLAAIREIFMPALSSTMTEGKIVSWLKQEGDKARAPPVRARRPGEAPRRRTLSRRRARADSLLRR